MATISTIILEYVCPSLGIITGNIMFFSPLYDIYVASYQHGISLNNLNPTPWIFMYGNCYGWLLYSMIPNPDNNTPNLFVFFANIFGFIISIWYNIQACKLLYSNYRSNILRQSIISSLNDTKFVTDSNTKQIQQQQGNEKESLLVRETTTTTTNIDEEMQKQQEQQKQQVVAEQVVLTNELPVQTNSNNNSHHNNNNNNNNNQHNEVEIGLNDIVTTTALKDDSNNNDNVKNSTSILEDINGTPTSKNTSKNTNTGIMDYRKLVGDVVAYNNNSTTTGTTKLQQQQQQQQPHQHEHGFLIMTILWIGITSLIIFGGNYPLSSSISSSNTIKYNYLLSTYSQKLIAGYCVNIILIFYYISPLSTIIDIMKNKTTQSLHIPSVVTSTFNGTFWCIYGFAVLDLFIMIPNGIGTITGIIQIILLFIYPRS